MGITDFAQEENTFGVGVPKRHRIFYTIDLDPDRKSVALVEHIEGLEKRYSQVLARNRSWRATMIRNFCQGLKMLFKEEIEVNGFKLWVEPVIASRIFIAQNVLSALDQSEGMNFVQVILDLTPEEVGYWAWKVADKKKQAIQAFKILHRNY